MAPPESMRSYRWLRVACWLTLAFSAWMLVNGARMTNPVLHSTAHARSTTVMVRDFTPVAAADAEAAPSDGRTPAAVVTHELVTTRASLPRAAFTLDAPGARPPGSEALGTSLPRSARWAVLGGHGRYGPGARTSL